MFKDKNLRKILWGFWYLQDKEIGGSNIILDGGRWIIPMSEGLVRFLLKKIDALQSEVEGLKGTVERKSKVTIKK